jgi:hydroxymethylbilane synthase
MQVELRVVRTTGDRILDVPLAKIGDRGLFTKEIDDALLAGTADLAVHSLKDVPTTLPSGLTIAAVTKREDPRDVLICRTDIATGLQALPSGARVGTSSLRRRAQLRAARRDLEILDLRGNLNTRLAKLDSGEYEAIILAAAGVVRLGWKDRISEYLDASAWLPAVGQGALAVVCRDGDLNVRAAVDSLNDPATAACTAAERALLHCLEGGCQIPIGALAEICKGELHLDGLVTDLDGDTALRTQLSGSLDAPQHLGERVADELIRRGGDRILAAIRSMSRASAPPIPAP